MNDMLTNERMYQALMEKDVAYEGLFVAAVKTTGIFCRPTCTARKPKADNVTFFPSSREAIENGYRPCKVCNPLAAIGQTPAHIRSIIDALQADPSRKWKDADLLQQGVAPGVIRRWFLKHHGVTFHAYQRMLRMNAAFKKIQTGETVTAAAFDAGYASLSGFADSFKSVFGVSPVNSKHQQVINITRLETPIGSMFACAVTAGICLLEFTERKILATEFKALTRLLRANIIPGTSPHFEVLKQELDEYFAGTRKVFTVPLLMPGTAFQQKIWQLLQTVPYGTTRSYKQQAIAAGEPDAVRALAHANGMNRIAILVPCHRLVGGDGSLTGYGGGIWRKKWLLELEKSHVTPS
ncbi:bifunctional transcriptional activator/DNA repair enzyme AdaA [Chitinophaga polysaccharea]|nr:methylated-DNA--[protein]-cysteine S-methyltransferase [Chitinophaga polysaccharea]